MFRLRARRRAVSPGPPLIGTSCRTFRAAHRAPTQKSDYLNQIIAFSVFRSDPLGARTQDPNIKSVVLYQLS